MSRIVHGKLVRDLIPEIIEASGKSCTIRTLSQEEYITALDAKLNEELSEYQADHSLEELADLLEVMMAVTAARGHDFSEVEALRRDKAANRGGFQQRIWLESVQAPD
ncbi:MAG: nucleoside triphosphate pyrophosphohydrolase [Clostridia bacterium]|nr:nucleoside triphosphate pyrophosphohydrolase [Clostridia bacterium]